MVGSLVAKSRECWELAIAHGRRERIGAHAVGDEDYDEGRWVH
jgi:hypothetical protein